LAPTRSHLHAVFPTRSWAGCCRRIARAGLRRLGIRWDDDDDVHDAGDHHPDHADHHHANLRIYSIELRL
jgi:hypothetical protein